MDFRIIKTVATQEKVDLVLDLPANFLPCCEEWAAAFGLRFRPAAAGIIAEDLIIKPPSPRAGHPLVLRRCPFCDQPINIILVSKTPTSL